LFDFTVFAQADAWISLLTLTALEVVLGIDNIVFITILAGRLPAERQAWARRVGLAVALVSRLLLLLGITWVMQLQNTLFTVLGNDISGKDIILIVGGLFLMGKATHEIYENVEHPEEDFTAEEEEASVELSEALGDKKAFSMTSFLVQVSLLDLVFSLDSVITAVGLVPHLIIMVLAILIAVGVMIAFAGPIGDFVQEHASVRVLALAFLVLIGFVLVFEGFERAIPKGYIYFAMAFSLSIELLNMRLRKKRRRKRLKERMRD